MKELLETEIKFLPGVGPKRAELLNNEINIFTYRDLLYYFPYKYIDRTRYYKIEELDPEMPSVQIKGVIKAYYSEGKGAGKRLVAELADETGSVKLVWFKGLKWITQNYPAGKEFIVFGKPGIFNGTINIIHPEIEDTGKKEERINSAFQAQYNTTEKLKTSFITSKLISKLVGSLIKQINFRVPETLPSYIVSGYHLMGFDEAVRKIHFPENQPELEKSTVQTEI